MDLSSSFGRAPFPILQRRIQNSMAPSHRVSTETLARIFELGLGLAMESDSADGFLLAVTSVCHLWRICAIGSPALWRFIVFLESAGNASSLWKIATYLERSAMTELEVVIHVVGPRSHLLTKFMQLWKPHLFRCQALTIALVNTGGVSPVLPLDGYLPLLRTLSVTLHGAPNRGSPHAIRLFEPRLQCTLRSFHLEVSADWIMDISAVSTGGMHNVSLQIPGLRRQQLAAILTQSDNLRSLTLRDVDDADSSFANSPYLPIPQLRALALEDCRLPLHTFRVPLLRSLTLGLHGGLQDYSYIFPFVTPFPSLQSLTLGIILDIPGLPALAAAFIRSCAMLKTLQLVVEPSATQILILLASNPRTMPPHLNLVRLIREQWVDEQAERSGLPGELQDTMFDLVQVLKSLLTVRPTMCVEWIQDTEREDFPAQLIALQAQLGDRVFLQEEFGDEMELIEEDEM